MRSALVLGMLLTPLAAKAACVPDETPVTVTGTVTSGVDSARHTYYSLTVDKPYCVHDADTGSTSSNTKSLYVGPDPTLAKLVGKKVTIVGHLSLPMGGGSTMLEPSKVTAQ